MGTDDTTTTVAEAPPGPPAEPGDTPIWDELAPRWARIVGGDDGHPEDRDDPPAKPRPPRKPRTVKK
jgi:hypothetical protein